MKSSQWHYRSYKKNGFECKHHRTQNSNSILYYKRGIQMNCCKLGSYHCIRYMPHSHQDSTKANNLSKMKYRCMLCKGKHMTGKLLIHPRTSPMNTNSKVHYRRIRDSLLNTLCTIPRKNSIRKCSLCSWYC